MLTRVAPNTVATLFVDYVKSSRYDGRMIGNWLHTLFRRRIYLDYASLTPMDSRVIQVINTYSHPTYANPSSLYTEGVAAKKALAQARASVAGFIHAHPDEIIFTGGGTEANNLALYGVVAAARAAGIVQPHLVISEIEHSSVREVARMLERDGCRMTRLPVDARGVVIIDELKKALCPETVLVSVMMVNNETGVIQPIRDIVKTIRHHRKVSARAGYRYPVVHTDAAQASLLDIDMEKTGIDLLTLDGSKVYGPRGVGCLYVRRDTPIVAHQRGGGQERGLRSGTENIPGIMGFAKALELVSENREAEVQRLIALRDLLISGLKKIRPDISINGAGITEGTDCAPHIVNVSIPGIDNEFFVLQLDARGVACSTKSSCLHDEDESYVLRAMGAESAYSVRFSLGRWTRRADIEYALRSIKEILG